MNSKSLTTLLTCTAIAPLVVFASEPVAEVDPMAGLDPPGTAAQPITACRRISMPRLRGKDRIALCVQPLKQTRQQKRNHARDAHRRWRTGLR